MVSINFEPSRPNTAMLPVMLCATAVMFCITVGVSFGRTLWVHCYSFEPKRKKEKKPALSLLDYYYTLLLSRVALDCTKYWSNLSPPCHCQEWLPLETCTVHSVYNLVPVSICVPVIVNATI